MEEKKLLWRDNALFIISVVADKEQQRISIFQRNKIDDSCVTSFDLICSSSSYIF